MTAVVAHPTPLNVSKVGTIKLNISSRFKTLAQDMYAIFHESRMSVVNFFLRTGPKIYERDLTVRKSNSESADL